FVPCSWGICACGHDEAWTCGVYCRIHGGDGPQDETNPSTGGGRRDGTQVLLPVEEEQRQEMKCLQQRLEDLPLDVVKRCTYLLRPLMDTATLLIFENNQVKPLRPLICNALLGRYVEFSAAANAAGGVSASETNIFPPGEMLAEQSFLARYFARMHVENSNRYSWDPGRDLQESLADIIPAFLEENFYRSILAIELIRHNPNLRVAGMSSLASDHDPLFYLLVLSSTYTNDDVLTSTSDYFLAVLPSLTQQYERNSNIRECRNPIADENFRILALQFVSYPKRARELLRQTSAPRCLISRLCQTFSAKAKSLPGFYETKYPCKSLAELFHPECTFQSFPSTLQNRLLALRTANREAWRRAHDGLLCMKPLAGKSEGCPEGWWDEVSRAKFLDYFRCLLEILSYMQDMNSIQRDIEWEPRWKLDCACDKLQRLHIIIWRSAQLASTDRTLLLAAIKETREAFEQRVGVIDRCFRVEPSTRTQGGSLVRPQDKYITSIAFQALGATSEIYEYDVSIMKVSIFQPLPRLLAALYGHGIEVGLRLDLLGLVDEGFANLVIERPLQMVAFFAQCSANLWLPNNKNVIEKLMFEISTKLSVEILGRDYQLLQQAAAVLPPDELIVRMVHKLNLKDYLRGTYSEPSQGSVQATESLLRVLHFIVTSRSRHAVGYFDPSIVAAIPSSPQLFPPDFNDLDQSLEILHGLLVDDIIHKLCLRPMTLSEILCGFPLQPPRCCPHKEPTYCGLCDPIEQISNTSNDNNKVPANRGIICRRHLVHSILQQLATQTIVGEEIKFTLRPEVLAVRFDLFYPAYIWKRQNKAKEAVFRTLTQAREANAHLFPADFPIPPPPPRPRRRFVDHLSAPILRLLRCPTFVHLLRQLLDIGIKYGSQQSRWSETLLELVLHLIIIALYEDVVAFAETGERPFLKVVSLVSEESESDEEFGHYAELWHWDRQDPPASARHPCIREYSFRVIMSDDMMFNVALDAAVRNLKGLWHFTLDYLTLDLPLIEVLKSSRTGFTSCSVEVDDCTGSLLALAFS
ncbi:unnamed protein product, partial [Dibothriocephalus latus]